MSTRSVFAIAAAAVLVVLPAAACGSSQDEPAATSGAAAASDSGASEDAGSGSGLPCSVEQVLTRCTTCHSAKPTSAPMPLVTYADLTAPAKSDPSRKVLELALERARSTTSPMPPGRPLAAAEIEPLARWIADGAPRGTCGADAPKAARDAGPECALASDCPGELVCKEGVCDVECITSKDCAPTWTCERTRCHPPDEAGGDAGATTTYSAFTSASAWSSISLAPSAAGSYSGVVFDGRYVHFAPDTTGVALRYDTKAPFGALRAWATHDLAASDARARGYRGAIFDGRYVYFVPSTRGGLVSRYDTQGTYLDPASWAAFDVTTVASAVGFVGGAFDGRYVYLVPSGYGVPAVRYDTEAPFATTTSWTKLDLAKVDRNAYGFAGAVFDGRYLYYVPSSHSTGPRSVVARYDTFVAFDDATSWTTLDLSKIDGRAGGYRTGAFDGRYLYLVPGWSAPAPNWASKLLARFDTQAGFGLESSWTFLDPSSADLDGSGFNAAAYDGRYLVLVPGYDGKAYHGRALRFDTRASATAVAAGTAWSTYDVGSLSPGASNIRGAAFDGRYMYFAPSSGVAIRFDARPSGGAPTTASFY